MITRWLVKSYRLTNKDLVGVFKVVKRSPQQTILFFLKLDPWEN